MCGKENVCIKDKLCKISSVGHGGWCREGLTRTNKFHQAILSKRHCAAQHRFPLDCTSVIMAPYLNIHNVVVPLALGGLKWI